MSIQYVKSIRVTCLDHFPICQEANGVSNNMELYTEVVKDICDNRMVSAFVKFLARGGYLFFNCYFKLGKKMFDFLMVGSTTILFGVNPLHK